MGEAGGGGGMAKDTDLILRSHGAASRRMGRGPHGSPGDAKHRPAARKDTVLTMWDRERMAESPIFTLAERPEPR
jgi:hypothetical protein